MYFPKFSEIQKSHLEEWVKGTLNTVLLQMKTHIGWRLMSAMPQISAKHSEILL